MECASRIWPSSSCRTNDLLPCRTPTRPRHRGAPCLPVASPRPPASTPMRRTFFRPRKGVKIPMALLPPPPPPPAPPPRRGPPPPDLPELAEALLPDHGLEVAHHHRVGMGSRRGSDEIVGGPDIRDPVPQRLVHRVFQRSASGEDRGDLRPEEPHPDDVRFLATDIFRAHVDHAGNPHLRAYRRGGDPVLPHSSRQKTLAERVVDLVGARVGEILPLEEDVRPFSFLREAAREVEGGRTAAVLPEQAAQFRPESLVPGPLPVCLLRGDHNRDAGRRHQPAGEVPPVPPPVGPPFTC